MCVYFSVFYVNDMKPTIDGFWVRLVCMRKKG